VCGDGKYNIAQVLAIIYMTNANYDKMPGQAVTLPTPREPEVFQAVVAELLESFSDAFPLDGIRLHESQARLIAAGICRRLFPASDQQAA
jgi:hypothetical protein